ncbi:MAG: hypothetical protein ACFFBZ_12430 [Promethearchaeota archaeon]
MSENFEDSQIDSQSQPNNQSNTREAESEKEIIEKDFVPHFLPTYRISSKFYALPIIFVVIIAGILSYLTAIFQLETGVQIDGGYLSEDEFGALGGIINGVIFTIMAAGSAFLIIYLVKKRGIDVLKYIFGLSFGFLSFFLSLFFSSTILYLIAIQFPESPSLVHTYNAFTNILLPIYVGIFTLFLLYGYFTSKSIGIKNIIVLYMGLLVGASMGVLMPLWTTLAILIGISLWDIFAVLYKKGPIKEMIDIASQENNKNTGSKKDFQEKIESGEAVYDTSKLEIGIGDLAFYSMLTSSALIQANSIIVMILTAIAIIIGTGITIMGLKRNKILPGLPISIFLGIGTMLISWYIISII